MKKRDQSLNRISELEMTILRKDPEAPQHDVDAVADPDGTSALFPLDSDSERGGSQKFNEDEVAKDLDDDQGDEDGKQQLWRPSVVVKGAAAYAVVRTDDITESISNWIDGNQAVKFYGLSIPGLYTQRVFM